MLIQVKAMKTGGKCSRVLHISAKFYITGDEEIYPVTNYMALEDIDLTQ